MTPGTRLGPYEILAQIGAGGMGEVYRARDPRLGRDVAIKVSKEQFSERFEREARAVAALNHPNICTLHDVGPNYLVMELIEGESPKGPLPLDEAMNIARQIADALEAAHEKGIVHRDLKPGNVKIKPDGTVKVLDFGLASVAPASAGDPENSPTLTLAGMIVGTAAYMSPEQARGKPVDKRADVWSFGVVLYEMITGRRPFEGGTVSDVLASVIKEEPNWDRVPANARRLLRRCLEKDPRRRLRDIGDAMALLEETPQAEGLGHRKLPWVIAALALALAVAAWWSSLRTPLDTHWSATRLGGSTVALGPRISPDGQLLAFHAMVDGQTQVAVMKPASGNWAVLTHDRSRGMIQEICWSPDGTKLYFDRIQDGPRGIFSVPALGGDERLVLEDAVNPEALPDGSLLVERLNSGRILQLHRFWPESGRLQPLKALVERGPTGNARVSSGGDRVAFLGRPLDDPTAAARVYAMELSSERIVRLAPGVSIEWDGGPFPLAFAADGRSVIFDLRSGDLHRIVSVPMDGSKALRTLLPLTTTTGFLDVGNDGSLYADQWQQPQEVVRFSPTGGAVEHLGETTVNRALPLPDGQVLFTSRTAGRERLLVAGTGKEPAPFLETDEETATPAAVVGETQVAFLIGRGPNRTIALASIGDRRVTRRLNGPRGAEILNMVSAPDGKTLYYTASGSVWTIPVSDGQPNKLRSGDGLTIDPYKQDLIIRLSEKEGVRLVRVPLGGGPERPIPVASGARPAPAGTLSPTAVGKDGRILLQVATGSSWFWPAGLLDPQTGRVQIPDIGYPADMYAPGWTADGKIVAVAEPFRSSLWRFRPEGGK